MIRFRDTCVLLISVCPKTSFPHVFSGNPYLKILKKLDSGLRAYRNDGKLVVSSLTLIKCLILFACSIPLLAQEKIALTGTVQDFDNTPITGAVLTLLGKNVSDTSDASGVFDIPTTPIKYHPNQIKPVSQFEVKQNFVYFSLDSREYIQIELFDFKGRKIQTVFRGSLEKGSFRFPLILRNSSCQVYVVCVKFGTSYVVRKSIHLNKNGTVQNPESQAVSNQKTGIVNGYRQSDVFDTLVVTHDDYINKRVWLYNYTDPVAAVLWDNDMRLTDEVTGWTDQPGHFAAFDTAQLYDLIDGGAPIYNDEGLVDGIYQFLENSDGNYCAISFYNFGTPENSLAMFTVQKNLVSSEVVIPGYNDSVALGDETIGGAMIYARFNQFDLELGFSGYTDVELLKNDAKLFLDVYKSKIGRIELKL